ncbi:hypothetical protein JL101_031465 (plasmid) [Skermanella rosea]|uniref:hypothetical protein n=1 Tax=Skermanella rosea TaxID=1817965 RepID=UPI001E61BB14|nr:hypothetical protein [Skermanella rosea]UEM07456.1 hypothetical protein JL101_031465 [Skermanella rosea]
MSKIGSMTLSLRGLAAGTLAIAAAFATGYWIGEARSVERTRVVATSCGVAPAEAPFYLPLRALQEQASHVPLLIGPITIPGAGTGVLLRFDPSLGGSIDTVTKLGDVLHLPKYLDTGSAGPFFRRNVPVPPQEIRLSCRDGALTAVHYRLDDVSATFPVVRQDDGTSGRRS